MTAWFTLSRSALHGASHQPLAYEFWEQVIRKLKELGLELTEENVYEARLALRLNLTKASQKHEIFRAHPAAESL